MALRLRMYDCRLSRLPAVIGQCQKAGVAIAQAINTAQNRLLFCPETGDEGWVGCFAEIAFQVSRENPYITLPRDIARLINSNVCNSPVAVNNQFVEYLQFGNGRMPKSGDCGDPLQCYTRNFVPTFVDLSNPPQLITVMISSPLDVGKRIFISGLDQNNNAVTSLDFLTRVNGLFLSLENPFVTSAFPFNSITGIQKDQTVGQVRVYQTDPNTGDQVLLLTMEPTEQTAWYRRYFFSPLPRNCCPPGATDITVTAIAKMEMIPVQVDTDFLLIQNLEAIINECQSARLSEVDNETSQKMSLKFHKDAVRSLNGQITHVYGAQTPATVFAPFGSARLERLNLGMQ